MTNPPDWKQDQAETSRLPRKGNPSAQTMLELDAERIALCERLIEYAGDTDCGAVHHNLASDLIEAEAALTLLADENAALRAASAPAAVREALERLAHAVIRDISEAKRRLDANRPKDGRPVHPVSAFLTGLAIDVGKALATPEEAFTRPSFCATADSICHHPACTCVEFVEEASTAAEEVVAPTKEAIKKALCCPSGCLRDDDCWVTHNKFGRNAVREHQANAIIALYAAPTAAQTDGVREKAADAIRTFCQSLGSAAVQMSHGEERIYYAGISLDALACAVALALSRPPRQSEEN